MYDESKTAQPLSVLSTAEMSRTGHESKRYFFLTFFRLNLHISTTVLYGIIQSKIFKSHTTD